MAVTKADLRRWKSDRKQAAEELGRVIDRRTSKLTPFVLNHMQGRLDLHLDLNPETLILKSRKLGASTYVAWRFFLRALLTPNYNAVIIAHTKESAEVIFQIVHRFYENLPADLRALAPKRKSSVRELRFDHGGGITVGTAGSESARGGTNNAILMDEFAFYVDADKAIAAILSTRTPDAEIVLATTANGLNHAHRMWFDVNSGYSKFFASWTDDPVARRKNPPAYVDPQVWVFQEDNGLTNEQANWVAWTLATACVGDWNLFNQEQPITPQVAFVSSGARVFKMVYPNAKQDPGFRIYHKPQPFRTYVMGLDPATGKPTGDFSAFTVLDITDLKDIQIAAVFYKRVSLTEYSNIALSTAHKYNTAFCVIEVNGPGPAVVEAFENAEYGNVWRRANPLKIGDKSQESLGFYTGPQTRPILVSRLRSYLDSGRVKLVDPNLQHEANTFIYNSSGKEEADNGCHDDGLISLGLALMGLDQTQHMVQAKYDKKPQGIKEILEWESATGELYDSSNFNDGWGESDSGAGVVSDMLYR